jgi:hypothetical protein
MKVLINAVWTLAVLFTSSAPLFQGLAYLLAVAKFSRLREVELIVGI